MSSSLLTLITSSFTTTYSKPNTSKARTNKTRGLRVSSCNVTPKNDNNDNQLIILPETQKLILPNNLNVDRRNLLVGLGGLCTTGNLSSLSSALADPITTPPPSDLSCKDASLQGNNVKENLRPLDCCPPNLGKEVKHFVFPNKREPVRIRWPAHKGTKEQIKKYKKAVAAMRALPEDHPHSFKQQASIHCAYCNGGYTQELSGYPDTELQIHNSWLFFPFHRWYLYFYERILGSLIDDPTFALPYWNWDNPAGMQIPKMFLFDKKENNPLYDEFRDPTHQPPQVINLDFTSDGMDSHTTDLKKRNLNTVYRDMVRNGGDTISFFGGVYVAGDDPVAFGDLSVGSVEASSHTAVHRWVGNSLVANGEDMGNFYSAGYDPLFYVHHTNVDRMWKLWKDLCLRGHEEPAEEDWLNASYVFYDENQDLVRVFNEDSVDIKKLKYNYAKSELPWINSRPPRRDKKSQVALIASGDVKSLDEVKFPFKLDKILKVLVKRPAVNRTDEEKAKSKENLLISGIKYRADKYVKFDVFVNDKVNTDEGKLPTPSDPEYAGCFAELPHGGIMSKMLMSSAVRFGLDELLEDTNTEGDEYVVVTLVPRIGTENLTIREIKIELVHIQEIKIQSVPTLEIKIELIQKIEY